MATVRIGNKLPNGLWMELITPGQGIQPAIVGKRVLLKGANSTLSSTKENPLVSKFAFTDVDEELAEAWFEVNKDALFVRNGSVFMVAKPNDAKAAAKERANEATGLEPLNPDKDKRVARGVTGDKDRLKALGIG